MYVCCDKVLVMSYIIVIKYTLQTPSNPGNKISIAHFVRKKGFQMYTYMHLKQLHINLT